MIQRWWYWLWQYMAFGAMAAFFRVRFLGRENVPLTGPLILLSNHQSVLDPILCSIGMHRQMDFVARESLFRNWLFGRYIGSLNAFPIQRDQADIQAIRSIIRRLQNNRAIILFPEGTRTPDGRIREIKSGFDLIVRRSGATVVPVVVDGAYETWPRNQALPGFGDIKVLYGRAFTAEQIRQLGRDEFVREINSRLRTMQTELRERYGKKGYDYKS
jgi:1-acyl-sn-glycerol-3-phosphate acyltransferase